MLLCEEYFKRHGLTPLWMPPHSKITLAGINRDGDLYFLFMSWMDENKRPSFYEATMQRLRPDRYESRISMESIKNETLYWDEYEKYLISQHKNLKFIADEKELKLKLWEISVRIMSKSYQRYVSDELFFKSFCGNSIDEKINGMDAFLSSNYMAKELFYDNGVGNILSNYSYDIAKTLSSINVKKQND